MGYAQHGKDGGLLDFIISIEICFNTGKYFFAYGGEKLGIIQGRIENNRGVGNKVLFLGGIIRKIGFNTEGYNLWDAAQTAAERNVGRLHVHRANKTFCPRASIYEKKECCYESCFISRQFSMTIKE